MREQYGMIFLLNLVKECEKKFKEKKVKSDMIVFDVFLETIRAKDLIPHEKLNKLLMDH